VLPFLKVSPSIPLVGSTACPHAPIPRKNDRSNILCPLFTKWWLSSTRSVFSTHDFKLSTIWTLHPLFRVLSVVGTTYTSPFLPLFPFAFLGWTTPITPLLFVGPCSVFFVDLSIFPHLPQFLSVSDCSAPLRKLPTPLFCVFRSVVGTPPYHSAGSFTLPPPAVSNCRAFCPMEPKLDGFGLPSFRLLLPPCPFKGLPCSSTSGSFPLFLLSTSLKVVCLSGPQECLFCSLVFLRTSNPSSVFQRCPGRSFSFSLVFFVVGERFLLDHSSFSMGVSPVEAPPSPLFSFSPHPFLQLPTSATVLSDPFSPWCSKLIFSFVRLRHSNRPV